MKNGGKDMSQGKLLGLAHLGVFVRDMEVSIDFYQRLGFSLDSRRVTDSGIQIAFLSAGSCILELVGRNVEPYRAAGIVDHIAILVDDLDAAINKAKANGIAIEAPKAGTAPVFGVMRNVFFAGPDEERLEFCQYL
jgi:catechol 2,3-dioxygenase-like lactoylglutathione lyase family enzyme